MENLTTKKITVKGYQLNNIKINSFELLGDVLETFQLIYTGLLLHSLDKVFFEAIETTEKYFDVVGVLDESLSIMQDLKAKEWLINSKIKSEKLTDNEAFEMQDMSYSINEKIINNLQGYKIIDNSSNGILINIDLLAE